MKPKEKPQNEAASKAGFLASSTHLKRFGKKLAATLHSARSFSPAHLSRVGRNTKWNSQWDDVDEILCRVGLLVDEIDAAVASTAHDRLEKAMEAWETLQTEDEKLMETLSSIRTQMSRVDGADRKNWNTIAYTLESHLEIIFSRAQMLRIKMELLKKYSVKEVERLFRQFQATISKLPADVKSHEGEYRKALAKLGMTESPEARLRRIGSLTVDPA